MQQNFRGYFECYTLFPNFSFGYLEIVGKEKNILDLAIDRHTTQILLHIKIYILVVAGNVVNQTLIATTISTYFFLSCNLILNMWIVIFHTVFSFSFFFLPTWFRNKVVPDFTPE